MVLSSLAAIHREKSSENVTGGDETEGVVASSSSDVVVVVVEGKNRDGRIDMSRHNLSLPRPRRLDIFSVSPFSSNGHLCTSGSHGTSQYYGLLRKESYTFSSLALAEEKSLYRLFFSGDPLYSGPTALPVYVNDVLTACPAIGLSHRACSVQGFRLPHTSARLLAKRFLSQLLAWYCRE